MDNNFKWDELYLQMQDTRESEMSQEELMYMFIDETDLDVEEVYSLVFMEGRKITWQ